MVLSIELADTELAELRSLATRLGVAPEALARVLVSDQLTKPAEDFERAAALVLTKNAELYRRLA